MNKSIHFYLYDIIWENGKPVNWATEAGPFECVCFSFLDTEEAIEYELDEIHTASLMNLSTELFDKGYHVFVHDYDSCFEITLGDCDRIDREIRKAHNLAHMIASGAFDLHYNPNR